MPCTALGSRNTKGIRKVRFGQKGKNRGGEESDNISGRNVVSDLNIPFILPPSEPSVQWRLYTTLLNFPIC